MTERRNKKRTPPISIRLSQEEKAGLDRRVAALGVSRNAYAKSRLLDQPLPRAARRPALEKKLVVALLAQAARVQDKLHEIQLTTDAESTLAIEQVRDELLEIRAALFAALGRK